MIRCNNCMKLYKDDSELSKILETQTSNNNITSSLYEGQVFDEEMSSVIDGCFNCLTDGYLMDLE